jgi:hypothetical protein
MFQTRKDYLARNRKQEKETGLILCMVPEYGMDLNGSE